MLNILVAFIGTFIGNVIGACGIVQILICLFCGIPCTNKLRKTGVSGQYGKIYKSLLFTILLWTALSTLIIYAIFTFGSWYLVFGLKWGLGISIVFSLGQWGCTEQNVSDYCQTYGKYLDENLAPHITKRFCKYCGGELDSNKKCTKCGKQFFHLSTPKVRKRRILTIMLVLIAICSIAVAFTYYNNYAVVVASLNASKEEYEQLATDYESLVKLYHTREDALKMWQEDCKTYQEMHKEQKEIADYWNRYGAITTPSGKKYHKYGCQHLVNAKEVYLWTIWDVKDNGYKPCETCY